MPADEVTHGSDVDASRGRTGPRHAAPKKPLFTRFHMPAGKAIAMAAMPTAVLMGMGFTSSLALADSTGATPSPTSKSLTADEYKDCVAALGDSSASPSPSASTSASPSESANADKDGKDGKNGKDSADGKDDTASPSPTATSGSSGKGASGGSSSSDSGSDDKATPSPSPSENTGDKATPSPSASSGSSGSSSGGDVLGAIGDAITGIFTGGKTSTASPSPSATPSASPSASASQGGSGDIVKDVTKGVSDTVKGTTEKVTGTGEDTAQDPTGKASEAAKDTTDAVGKAADAATPTPTATPSPSASASADAGNCPLATDDQSGVQTTVADDPWHLDASSLLLKGADYQGVVEVKTASGATKKVLKYVISEGTDIGDLHQTVDDSNSGKTYHVQAAKGTTSTIRDGDTTMYTESISGNLFGLIPVTFTPDSPPPLNIPLIYFTNVKVLQAAQFGGTLTIPGMHVYTTD
ncbi:hypothetical protein ACIO13_35870 [Streptomyces sp. NPDC087425]|uniref:hypothetical protein n=1 Tax=Streptomyces sp. NPDC087425 TaxID=3365787 RepID=UPI0037F3515F